MAARGGLRLGVIDDEVLFGPHHFGEILQGHIGTRVGIVEPAVRVLLDDDRAVFLVGIPCHVPLDSLTLGGLRQGILCRNCEISSTFFVRSTRAFAARFCTR